MRSTIPQAYVDITYDFFMNIIAKGVFVNQITKGEVLGSSYSHCAVVGSEKITIVSLDILIDCIWISCDWTLIFFLIDLIENQRF